MEGSSEYNWISSHKQLTWGGPLAWELGMTLVMLTKQNKHAEKYYMASYVQGLFWTT